MVDNTKLIKTVQYVVGLGAFLWVASQADWTTVGNVVRSANVGILVAIMGLTLTEFGGRFFVWHLLLNRVKRTSFRSAGSIDLVIMFINHLLPSRLSGRAVAPVVIRHYTRMKWSEAVALAGVHTGIHAILYGMGAAVGILFLSQLLNIGLLLVISLSTLLYVGAGTVILVSGYQITLVDRFIDWLQPYVAKLPAVGDRLAELTDKAPEFTGDSARVFKSVTGDPVLWVLYTCGWLVKIMLAPTLRVWLLLGIFGVQFSNPLLLPFVIVAAYSITLFPITPGGIGVAEATATIVFVALGVPEGIASSVIILDRFFGVYIEAMIGWLPVMNVDLDELARQDGK
jgi:uncharacterized protein (TIRG00374 family)